MDEMHLAITPVLLGSGESLLGGLNTKALGYACTQHGTSDGALHCVLTRS